MAPPPPSNSQSSSPLPPPVFMPPNSRGAGLSRSSATHSLAQMAAPAHASLQAPAPHQQPQQRDPSQTDLASSPPESPWFDSRSPSSTSTPSGSTPGSSSAASSAPSSSHSNSGFIVTSRPKNYFPPMPPPSAQQQFDSTLADRSGPSSTSLSPPLTSNSATRHHQPARTSPTLASSSFRLPSAVPVPSTTPEPTGRGGSLRERRESPPPPLGHSNSLSSSATSNAEPKTTLTLSSSIDSQGRRMVNQYVRLKTIGQGSHGKVWLCAEPILRESDEEEGGESNGGELSRNSSGRALRREGKDRATEDPIYDALGDDGGDVVYCAIKSVAREGPRRGKSLRAAKHRKEAQAAANGHGGPITASASTSGIGQDDKVKREVAIMKRLSHKNVVRLKEVIDDVKSKKVFMVLEFMAGGQIVWQDDNKRPTMTVDEARRTFRDVVLGLEYLHYQGIIHRDIKPANLLWTEDHSTVKISDFGVSHVSEALQRATPDGGVRDDDRALRTTAGSPAFFAPELCHPAEYNNPTPTPTRSAPNNEGDEYFASSDRISLPAGSPLASPAITRTRTSLISQPLPSPNPTQPRKRPTIGKGIDVWALGVTLYCLLFGDTPFMAKTEYELYTMIVKQPVKVPERMGAEGAWTGIGPGWEGCGDGVEGREVVDLLNGLLQKDPAKRIGLDQVKKHPWVLRNLTSSPDSWLHDTDPEKSDTVIITEEDVEHATQARGPIESLPQMRNRPGLRRALHAALVRFPAFSRIKTSHSSGRSRSKSTSSASHSAMDNSSENAWSDKLSRQPSDAASQGRKKSSTEFGVDIRRIISASGRETSPPRSSSVAPAAQGIINGGRGGWGSRLSQPAQARPRSEPPTPLLAELSRSVSASSVGGTAGSTRRRHHLFPSRKNSGCADLRSSTSSARSESPAPLSETDTTVPPRRTLTKIMSRFGGGTSGRATPRPGNDRRDSLSGEESLPDSYNESMRQLPAAGLPSLAEPFQPRQALPANDVPQGDEEDDFVDSSDYSSDEDDDELLEPPLARVDGISGWQSSFHTYGTTVDVGSAGFVGSDDLIEDEEERKPASLFTIEASTPRASATSPLVTRGLDPDPSTTPPALVARFSRPAQARDGSIRSGHEAHFDSGPKWEVYHSERISDDDEDDEGQEIFVAATPRRKRAPTLPSPQRPHA